MKFNERVEQILSEGKTKNIKVKGLRYEPGEMIRMAIEVINKMLLDSSTNPIDEIGYDKKELKQDYGIDIDGFYSAGYQRDPEWEGYLTLNIDSEKYDGKDITNTFKEIRSNIKEHNKHS